MRLGFPSVVFHRPSFPFDKVEELSSSQFGIEDGFDIVVFFSFDYDWSLRSNGLTRNGGRRIESKLRSSEHGMDFHRRWKFEFEGIIINDFENEIRTNSFVAEFL